MTVSTKQSFFQSASNHFKNKKSSDVGYRVGHVQSYKAIKTSGNSTLYQISATQLDDGRPLKLLDLYGSHYQVGFDYGYMLADEIVYSYNALFGSQIENNTLLTKAVELFFDWQYADYVKKQTPIDFLQEIKGVKDGAYKSKKISNINRLLERVMVVSNFPGYLENDVMAVLFDQFLKMLGWKNILIRNFIQTNLLYVIRQVRHLIQKNRIMCSFFGVWGSRTQDGELYTMRNLDWAQNTGLNLNKMIVVFHIDDSYAHAVLGFPGILGALTGISEKGITVSQTGVGSDLESMEGFQWTLRIRYVMMKAKNLNEAMDIWKSTKNTLGMNFLIGSAADKKAVALQIMRGYTAFFEDNDPRQNQTIFTDQKGNMFVAGHSMPQAVFRTNHAYDPKILKNSITKYYSKSDNTIVRYFILKDEFNSYKQQQIKIGAEQALRIAAILGDKGGKKFYSCEEAKDGNNVISVMYLPSELKMWASFQYGAGDTYRSACCGVYLEIQLKQWFAGKGKNGKYNGRNVRLQRQQIVE